MSDAPETIWAQPATIGKSCFISYLDKPKPVGPFVQYTRTDTIPNPEHVDLALRYVMELALRQATDLAVSLAKKHYSDNDAKFEPLDDISGVISQIDNMTTGLSRAAALERMQWNTDMEAMPKGTEVLLFGPRWKTAGIGVFDPATDEFYCPTSGAALYPYPTKWMHLPPE